MGPRARGFTAAPLAVLSSVLVALPACELLSLDGLSGASADELNVGGDGDASPAPSMDGGSPSDAPSSAPPSPPPGADASTANDASKANDASTRDAPAASDGPASADAPTPAEASTADDAEPEASPSCPDDLSNVGTGDFQVSFIVTSTQSGYTALVNQRNECTGSVAFWDIRADGPELYVEVDDGQTRASFTTQGATVNDGAAHLVFVRRASGTLTAYIDGSQVGSQASPQSLGALPPIQVGVDPCDGKDGTAAFTGTLVNVCVVSP